MAKGENTLLIVGLVVLGLMWMNQQQATPAPQPAPNNGGSNINLCTVVEPSASFTGQRMFLEGTALTAEYVRVIKNGGTKKDLGQISLNSGTLNTAPEQDYLLYYGENSTTYYTHKEAYKAPCQDAVDDKTGVLCAIDRTPEITEYNEDGNSMANGSTNCEPLAADGSIAIDVKVKTSADQCFGNPDSSKDNIICFEYRTTYILDVDAGTSVSTPYSVSTLQTNSSYAIKCFSLPKLKDNVKATGETIIPVTITATSTEPGVGNITVLVDDIAFDLHADTLEEIWDFVDEDNNVLDAQVARGNICVT